MAVVFFSSELENLFSCEQLQVTAVNYRELLVGPRERLPNVADANLEALALVIDGEIVQEPFLATFDPASELHFIQKIAAG